MGDVGAPDAPVAGVDIVSIDNASRRSILSSAIPRSERGAPPVVLQPISAFPERIPMSNSNAQSVEERIAGVVHRLLAAHAIDRDVSVDEDLRQAGLSSLDMVSLVLVGSSQTRLIAGERPRLYTPRGYFDGEGR